MRKRARKESVSPKGHAHASLFSPSSKFRVEYKHVVTVPDSISKRDAKTTGPTVHENGSGEEAAATNVGMGRKTSKRGKAVEQQPRNDKTRARHRRSAANSSSSAPSENSSDDDDEDVTAVPLPARSAGEGKPSTAARDSKKKKQDSDKNLAALADEALNRTIFVGNLSESTTKKQLKAHFEKYGPVESVRFRSMMLKKDSKVPRRAAAASGTVDTDRGSFHAYVVFENIESISPSLQENMKVLDDRHLRVDRAAVNQMRVKLLGATKGSRAAAELISGSHQVHYDVHRSVFVGNMPLDIEDEDLIRFFIAGLGAGSDSLLEAVRIVRDPKTSVGKGIAFALFKTRAARKQALKLNGRILDGRKLRITEVQSDSGSEASQYTRVSSKKASQSWQGATATKSGRVRGINKRAIPRTIDSSNMYGKSPKRTGKRPAVAARKLAMKMKRKAQ